MLICTALRSVSALRAPIVLCSQLLRELPPPPSSPAPLLATPAQSHCLPPPWIALLPLSWATSRPMPRPLYVQRSPLSFLTRSSLANSLGVQAGRRARRFSRRGEGRGARGRLCGAGRREQGSLGWGVPPPQIDYSALRPEFLAVNANPFYDYVAGALSPYGHEALLLTRSVRPLRKELALLSRSISTRASFSWSRRAG